MKTATSIKTSGTSVDANDSVGAGFTAGYVGKACFVIDIDCVRAGDAVVVCGLGESYRWRGNVAQVCQVENLQAMRGRFTYYKQMIAKNL